MAPGRVAKGMESRRIPSPVYGSGLSLAIFGLLLVAVHLSRPALVAVVTTAMPTTGPREVTTALAVALWVGLGLVLVLEARRQYVALSPAFVDRERFVAHLDARRLDTTGWVVAGIAVLAGLAVVGVGYATALRTLDAATTVEDGLWLVGVTGSDIALTVAVLAGYVAAAWGLDRVVVGAVRELQYRRVTE